MLHVQWTKNVFIHPVTIAFTRRFFYNHCKIFQCKEILNFFQLAANAQYALVLLADKFRLLQHRKQPQHAKVQYLQLLKNLLY